MANITTYLEKALLAHSVGKTNFDKPANTYVGLFITTPTADYTVSSPDGVELTTATAPGYARCKVAWNTPSVNTDLTNSSNITNTDTVTTLGDTPLRWPVSGNISGSNWGIITTIGIFDAPLSSGSPAGNLLWFGALSSPVTLNIGDNFTIQKDSLTLTLG